MRDTWLRARGIDPGEADDQSKSYRAAYLKLSERDRRQFEREISTALNRYLDAGHGCCALRIPECLSALRACLFRFDGDRYDLGDFVIMSNHVHCLITPIGKMQKLEKIIGGIKGASARKFTSRALAPELSWV